MEYPVDDHGAQPLWAITSYFNPMRYGRGLNEDEVVYRASKPKGSTTLAVHSPPNQAPGAST